MLRRKRLDRVLRYQLGQRLLELRDGDVGALVDQAIWLDHGERSLVGLRDRGLEAVTARRAGSLGSDLSVYALDPELDIDEPGARPERVDRLGHVDDVQAWLEGEAFEWVHPRWREG